MISRLAALPLWAKILIALVALGLAVVLSPFTVVAAFFGLVIAIIVLVYRILRRRPLKTWGLVALTSLVLVIAFSGISEALYGGGQPKQTPSSTDNTQETEQASSETAQETLTPPKTTAETTTEETITEDSSAPSSARESTQKDKGKYDATVTVTRVVDGDTLKISPAVDGYDELRLIGIDTPETKEPGCKVQPYGPEASKFTTTELQGKEVELEFDQDKTDPYKRLLAYVYKDKEMFNETLLEEGYAQVATFPPNVKYVDRFEEDQANAQASQRGIWGLSDSELAKLKDRGNGIGGEGCEQEVSAPPHPSPQPSPQPSPSAAPSSTSTPSGSYPPISKTSCPAEAPIKGNQSGIYHPPGSRSYNVTNPEECFATQADAQAAGYRAPRN